MPFSILPQFISSGYLFHVQFLPMWSFGSFVLFAMRRLEFLIFFVGNFETVSRLKLMFWEGPSFFVRSVCNHGALNWRLHVVALSVSMTVSWPAKTTWKLHRSGLDFLVLALESSNSFYLNAFFNFASVYFVPVRWSMFRFCFWGLVFPLFCYPCQDWSFWVFLVWNLQTVFTGNPCFRNVFHFLFFFSMMEFWACSGTW